MNLTKPTVGGSLDSWGALLNSALDTLAGGINDGAAAITAHANRTDNPHAVTAAQVSAAPKPASGLNGKPLQWNNTSGQLEDATTAIQALIPVTSVASKTGAVSLAKADVGLSNVDNTSDANKPVSTAVAAAITALNGIFVQYVDPAGGAAAVQAAHDALPSSGGELRLGRGTLALGTNTVTISKPVKIVGHGPGDLTLSAPTKVTFSGATGNAFNVTAHGVSFEDLCVVNVAGTTPTAGAGINFATGSGVLTHLTRVHVSGFWNDVVFADGSYWTITDCTILDPVNYGLLIQSAQGGGDWGDPTIVGTIFMVRNQNYTPPAAIRYESGGGLKVSACKIVSGFVTAYRFVNGLDLAVADGVGTGDLMFVGNSVEGCTGAQVKIGQKGTTGQFIKAVITGNEFGAVPSGGTGVAIAASSTGANNYIRDIEIGENIFQGLATGISVQSMTGASIGRNEFSATNVGAASVTTPISIGNAVVGYDVARQSYSNADACDLITDGHNAGATPGQRIGTVDYTDSRDLNVAAQNTWQTLWTFDIADGGATTVQLEIDGVTTDNGSNRPPFVLRQERAFTRAQGGGSIAGTTIGTDFSNGIQVAVVAAQFSGTSSTISVQVQTTSATYTKLLGSARLTLRGNVTKFHRGA